MKIAILTSPNQWFVPYAEVIHSRIDNSKLFLDHKEIDESYDLVFIISYHKIIEEQYLKKHKHNIVIHESELPKGKGWAPMFWQILEEKNKIPFTMFEASSGVDDGNIYMQKILNLTGFELNDELREKQASFTIEMCLEFVKDYSTYCVPVKQTGQESFYSKRSANDSLLDVNKTIKEQFNLLRIVNNNDYPAFFELNGYRYKLTIEKMEK